MRPVNLIPPEARGERAPTRRGPAAYVIVGVLAVALVGVYLLVSTSSKIEERKAEIASLEQREADATARAEALQPYVEFANLAGTRELTVTQLATSRFDWERVLNELALVMPDSIWLVEVTGTVGPEVPVDGAGGVSTRSSIQAPALEMIGCGVSQDAVAGFVAALEDIDGVTRVGLEDSSLPGTSEGGGGGEDCRTRDFIAQFKLVVAFDAATSVPAGGASAESAPVPPEAPPEGEAAESGTAAADAAATATPARQARQSVEQSAEGVDNAANIVPGVAR